MFKHNMSNYFIAIIIFSLVSISCGGKKEPSEINSTIKDTKKESRKLTKEEQFKIDFPTMEYISSNNSVLIVKGTYEYSGDIDRDCRKIDGDVWALANKYPEENNLKLKIFFKGTDRYGNARFDEIGTTEAIKLNEVRKYKGPEFYGKDLLSGGQEVFQLLVSSKNSPYRINY